MSKISFQDFQKLDLRIGTVTKAEVPDWSHWVMKLTVDFGNELGEKTIFAGFKPFFKPEELEGKQYPFLINLEPKKIGPQGDYSEGMLLAIDRKLNKPIIVENEEIFEKPILLMPCEPVSNGTKIR
jgi:methionine--tRNA ligase beta chain